MDVDGRMESSSAGTENMQVRTLLNFCSLFNDFSRYGSVEHIHSDSVSRILLGKSLSRTNEVYYHTFDLTRNIASIPARPATI